MTTDKTGGLEEHKFLRWINPCNTIPAFSRRSQGVQESEDRRDTHSMTASITAVMQCPHQ